MRYLIVAEAYRDLERVSSRLALTERLAALLAQTPVGLLPTVCYLSQGLICSIPTAHTSLSLARLVGHTVLLTAVLHDDDIAADVG